MSKADELRARAKLFAIQTLKFLRALPRDPITDSIARQLARSATSVSANYHSAGRARSRREYISKLGVVAEEADESQHWLEVLNESGIASGPELSRLLAESRELRAIFVASVRTARKNHQGEGRSDP